MTRELTPTETAVLARLDIDQANGPQMASEGDLGRQDQPTARELGALAGLPADWSNAMATNALAIEALGTPNATNGAFLQRSTSAELYTRWVATLEKAPPGASFVVTRMLLSQAVRDVPAVELVSTGRFTLAAGKPSTGYVVFSTVTRVKDRWVLSAATFRPDPGVS